MLDRSGSKGIPGSSTESVLIDLASETVEFTRATRDDQSRDSESSSSDDDLLPDQGGLDQNLLNENEWGLLSPSLQSFSDVRKFWEERKGGEAHL